MFCTVEDLETFLQIDIPAEKVDSAERAIAEATAAIQNYCRQRLERVVNDVVTLDSPGTTRLFLRELPVVAVTSVIEDSAVLTEGDDYQLGEHGILYRVGRTWERGIQIVTVTYTHGYDPLPDDIVAVCVRAASRAYQSGLRTEALEGIPGITAQSLGDYSVQYGSERTIQQEGILGASAPPLLLRSEKDILARYRV